MKKFIEKNLGRWARKIIAKYQPKIVAVTGSVGKTSTKDAIYEVLNLGFPGQVRKSQENYNNELGVPLTILGAPAPGRKIGSWINLMLGAWAQILFRAKYYPKILILEMAADRPGDIEYLTRIAPPDVAVVTSVGPSHLEFFPSLAAIRDEKEKLVKATSPQGIILLNRDDPLVATMQGPTAILKFGIAREQEEPPKDEALATHIRRRTPEEGGGLGFRLKFKGDVLPIELPYVLGRHQIYAALAAACVGLYFRIYSSKIKAGLARFQSPPGRMRLMAGIKNTLIIDDTYNASPASTIAALGTLNEIACERRKVAILGDMLELGPETERGHREVGRVARETCDFLITVGDRANFAADEARKLGMPEENNIEYNYTEEAMDDIENILKPNDIVLVKGSQAMRMEKIVKDIMFEPLRATQLLVRQNAEWEKR